MSVKVRPAIPGSKYHMASDIMRQWQTIENNLILLARGLINRHIQVSYEWQEIRVSTLPYECGYQNQHKTSQNVLDCMYNSRKAFVTLTSLVSFAIALDTSRNPTLINEVPSWVLYAQQNLHMDPVWVNELRDTFVCDFSPGFRPGCYLKYYQAIYPEVISAYIEGNVPLYICWTFWPRWLSDDNILWAYRPTHDEAKRAIDSYCKSQLTPSADPRGRFNFWYNMAFPKIFAGPPASASSLSPSFPTPPSRPVIPRFFPNVPPPPDNSVTTPPTSSPIASTSHLPYHPRYHSPSPQPAIFSSHMVIGDSPASPLHEVRQRPFNTNPTDWLASFQRDREAYIAVETESQRLEREKDEATAAKENADPDLQAPTVGSYIYIWHPSTSSEYKYVMSAVDESKWKSVWPHYLPQNRHFASLYQEWHLITLNDQVSTEEEESEPLPQEKDTGSLSGMPKTMDIGQADIVSVPTEIGDLYANHYSTFNNSNKDGNDSDSDSYSEDDSRRAKRKRNQQKNPRQSKKTAPLDNRLAPHLLKRTVVTLPPTIRDVASNAVLTGGNHQDVQCILFNKYGLLLTTPYVTDPRLRINPRADMEEGEILPSPSLGNVTILKSLGLYSITKSQDIAPCLCDVFRYVTNPSTRAKLFPPLWDLAPNIRNVIIDHDYFQYHMVDKSTYLIGIHARLPMERQYYLLYLSSPRAVVELFRATPVPSSIAAMIRYLVENGVSFRTVKPVATIRTFVPVEEHNLGFREKDHIFNGNDWSIYQTYLRNVVNGPAGRAAVLRGGIVWRLTYQLVKTRRILNGPTTSARDVGFSFGNRRLIDDVLTSGDEDIICGVFKVGTGMSHSTIT
ncbi:hypothetical protein C0991_009200 [Blastosporella zonata]|nr:hypothetical protein C0991_009200 [Blastosporella zonata]